MAKEQWHRWGQTAVTIITLAFVCGITYSRIEINTNDIEDIEVDVKVVQKDVHDIQVSQQREIALKENLLSTLIRLEGKVDKFAEELGPIKTGMEIMEVKYGTLTKD